MKKILMLVFSLICTEVLAKDTDTCFPMELSCDVQFKVPEGSYSGNILMDIAYTEADGSPLRGIHYVITYVSEKKSIAFDQNDPLVPNREVSIEFNGDDRTATVSLIDSTQNKTIGWVNFASEMFNMHLCHHAPDGKLGKANFTDSDNHVSFETTCKVNYIDAVKRLPVASKLNYIDAAKQKAQLEN